MKLPGPLVSVVVPVYNGERFIAQALASLRAQTYPNLEVIVVDDGSTDRSAALVRASGLALEYVHQANQGIARAYNRGIARARGEYVGFLEQDDVWFPDKLAREMDLFERQAGLGLVYSRYHRCDAQGRYDPADTSTLELRGDCFKELLVQTLTGTSILPFSSATVRRSVLEQVGPLDDRLRISVDYDLWLKLASRSAFGFVDAPGLLYRQHDGNTSRNALRAVEDDLRIITRWSEDPRAVRKLGRRAMRERLARCHRDLAWLHGQAGDELAARAANEGLARLRPASAGDWTRWLWSRLPRGTTAWLAWRAAKWRARADPASPVPTRRSID